MRGKENLLVVIGVVALFLIVVLMFIKPNLFSYSPKEETPTEIIATTSTSTSAFTTDTITIAKDENRITIE